MSPLETGLNQVNWHLGERNTEPGHSTRFLNTQEEKTDKTDSQLLFREEGQSGLHLPVPGALASCIPSRCTLWGGAGRAECLGGKGPRAKTQVEADRQGAEREPLSASGHSRQNSPQGRGQTTAIVTGPPATPL